MRKVILFILSAGMLLGGLFGVAFEVFFARIIFFRFVIGGCMLAGIGCYLLWTDFVAPALGIKTWEDEQGR
jgi:hypothetical protein